MLRKPPGRIEPEVALGPAGGCRPDPIQGHGRQRVCGIPAAKLNVLFQRVSDETVLRPQLPEVRHIGLCLAETCLGSGHLALERRELGLSLLDRTRQGGHLGPRTVDLGAMPTSEQRAVQLGELLPSHDEPASVVLDRPAHRVLLVRQHPNTCTDGIERSRCLGDRAVELGMSI